MTYVALHDLLGNNIEIITFASQDGEGLILQTFVYETRGGKKIASDVFLNRSIASAWKAHKEAILAWQ